MWECQFRHPCPCTGQFSVFSIVSCLLLGSRLLPRTGRSVGYRPAREIFDFDKDVAGGLPRMFLPDRTLQTVYEKWLRRRSIAFHFSREVYVYLKYLAHAQTHLYKIRLLSKSIRGPSIIIGPLQKVN